MNDQKQSSQGQENKEIVQSNRIEPPIETASQPEAHSGQNVIEEPNKDESWRSILTILALILMPVIGIILTWLISGWSKKVKITITVIFGIIALILIGSLVSMYLYIDINATKDSWMETR